MAGHGPYVIKVAGSDLNDVVVVVPQPSSNQLIAFRGFGVAVEVVAQPVQVDAYALVIFVVIPPVNDVRCRCSDRPVENKLLATDWAS